MLQACRPAGRLFYLVLAMAALTIRVAATPQGGPTLTNVVDTVYRADGSVTQGILVITWPAFVEANGTAVAEGTLNVTLGTNGALNVALAPNAGANPPGAYYTVVFQLGPGQVRTEYWLVPTSSPATLAQVRTTPGSGTASPGASVQYVNTAIASKANDNAVVHLSGTETISGSKTFTAPPNVPTPVATGDVTNKAYVDSAIATVGAGSFVSTAGGAMTGPLTLSGTPTAPLQAADKQYVDLAAAAKADLISGLVPTSELGTGTASGLNCLLGSGAWGPCGSSANATAIQSVPVASSAPGNGQVLTYSSSSGQYAPATPSGAAGGVVTGPAANQNIVQPVGTQMNVNNLSGIRYVTPTYLWSVSPSGSLVGGTQATVTLTPCPVGIDTTGNSMYFVYISGQGTPEPAMVTGGTCTGGAASGTIVFTPKNTHAATYVLASASSGIQEAINDACGVPNGSGGNPNARVVLPATGATSNALPIYGSVFAHCSRALIEGNGTLLSCSTRDRCIVLGDLVNSNHYGGVTLRGMNMTSTVNADGCQITNTQRQSNVVTITVASGCNTIQTGDLVNINFTDYTQYWGSHGPVTVAGTSITYSQTGANLAAVASPGTIAIQNAAIEDNAIPGTMEDIKSSSSGGGKFNQFFVVDNDQAATIRNFDADGSQGLLCTANHCGSYVYSAGNTAGTPVLWLEKLNISPQCGGNGVTVYANNTTHISDSVMQGFGMWGIYTSTILGSFGGTQVDNVYNEEGAGPCPNPYLGNNFSAAGIIYGAGGSPLVVRGGEQPNGVMPIFANTGSTQYNYYVVVHDTTGGTSYPLYAGYALNNGSGSIRVQWPHVAPQGTVTYDVVRMTPGTLAANSAVFPVQGECSGGSTTACGSVATNLAQCSGLVCSYTDSASASTSSYTIATPGYFPALTFWPGGLVLNGNGSTAAGTLPSAILDTDTGSTNTSAWISTAGFLRPTIYARQCSGGGQVPYGGAWVQCLEGDSHGNGFSEVGSLLLNNGPNTGGQAAGLKGRLNFAMSPADAVNQSHIITLVDSNPAKTLATTLNRPLNDAADTYIGLDQGPGGVLRNLAQLAFGAPVAISSYIGNSGDNTNFLERLTASTKTFKVPVTIDGNLTVTGTCTGCGGGGGSGTVNSGTAMQVAMYSANGAAVSGDSGLTDSGTTLNYAGSNGISAAAGTFSGNVTVNGQLLMAGPWIVSSPIPGTAMAAAEAGTSALGISNDGNFYISANAGSPQKVATTATSSFFTNLFQEDANNLGEYNGTSAQGLNIYGTRTDASNFERLRAGYDGTNNYFTLTADYLGTGQHRGLGFNVNGSLRWVIDTLNTFKPWSDNVQDVGSGTLRIHNGYFGTGVITPSLTLNGAGLSAVIGTPSANLMTAGTVSGTGAPLCTDGTGNLTITTVGCPPGTGTLGGSGTTPQFAYWTNTNGLGAAPLFVTGTSTVEQYNGTNVQTFNVYGTRTDASNYERAGLAYVSADGYYELQTQQAGTGSQRGICFGVNNSCKWAVDTTTALKPFNDNTRDIGTSSLRVRDFYLARNLVMSGTATTYNGKTTAGTGLAPIYGAVSLTGQTAAIASTALCASATCGAGQYIVNYYVDSTLTCTTVGSATTSLTIGWTDETGAKTFQAPLSGTGVSGGNSLPLGNTSNFGSGDITLWSAGSANITYATAYTGCTTGTGTYAVRATVRQVQ